ncbi:MAG: hypothetical protein F6J90_03660 [Moorea sp. SIOASIH]|uniref:hypothetical protein n=1 Tax=Moorena sp. SIOASIH TaxID=2607817 RepID=UPI0013BDF7F6|nr:hypothetical protein [Moorena sp. SIOASIH]NEO35455.1 hypothetical protein [Moorena sp. SIOASIH]
MCEADQKFVIFDQNRKITDAISPKGYATRTRPCLLNPSRPSPYLFIPIFQSRTTDIDGEMGRWGDGQMKLMCSRNEPELV